MRARRQGREAAVQLLYQRDLNQEQSISQAIDYFWKIRAATDRVKAFCNQLAMGVMENQLEIDATLKKHIANYEMHRVAAVDRNILRLAIYEMKFCHDIPPVVSINEAIELAKSLGSPESGRFVNGILDKVREEIPRSARSALTP